MLALLSICVSRVILHLSGVLPPAQRGADAAAARVVASSSAQYREDTRAKREKANLVRFLGVRKGDELVPVFIRKHGLRRPPSTTTTSTEPSHPTHSSGIVPTDPGSARHRVAASCRRRRPSPHRNTRSRRSRRTSPPTPRMRGSRTRRRPYPPPPACSPHPPLRPPTPRRPMLPLHARPRPPHSP
jgi:hypothetical protein